jgi:hypothetical protein
MNENIESLNNELPDEAYFVCDECNGEGFLNTNPGHLYETCMCKKCQGEGKVDWIENIFGKKDLHGSSFGYSGTSGYTGSSGVSGFSGSSGFGLSGYVRISGVTGCSGYNGLYTTSPAIQSINIPVNISTGTISIGTINSPPKKANKKRINDIKEKMRQIFMGSVSIFLKDKVDNK